MEKQLVWKKKLSRTDAQRQKGNQTGDLRLTQANFKQRGRVIDQTKYFRYEVFAEGDWNEPNKPPQGIKGAYTYREVATILFRVNIEGERRTRLCYLDVSHKKSGEAGQGNYTTGIRWGAVLTHVLRERIDVSGMFLELYKLSDMSFEMNISNVNEN